MACQEQQNARLVQIQSIFSFPQMKGISNDETFFHVRKKDIEGKGDNAGLPLSSFSLSPQRHFQNLSLAGPVVKSQASADNKLRVYGYYDNCRL